LFDDAKLNSRAARRLQMTHFFPCALQVRGEIFNRESGPGARPRHPPTQGRSDPGDAAAHIADAPGRLDWRAS